jgi:uncharacterized protein YbjQ (UPF0145 family)
LPSCEKPYEVIGIVTSGKDHSTAHFSTFMDEIKKVAYYVGADAVNGITFQTLSTSKSYEVNVNSYVRQKFSEIKSRAVGTAIKYIENN